MSFLAAERLVTLRGSGSDEPMPCDRIRLAVPGTPSHQMQSQGCQALTQAQLPRRKRHTGRQRRHRSPQFQFDSTIANAPIFSFLDSFQVQATGETSGSCLRRQACWGCLRTSTRRASFVDQQRLGRPKSSAGRSGPFLRKFLRRRCMAVHAVFTPA